MWQYVGMKKTLHLLKRLHTPVVTVTDSSYITLYQLIERSKYTRRYCNR